MSLKVDILKKLPNFTLEVSFEAGDETLGFLGASGSGKSLTMRCIAGIVKPDEGRIIVDDQVFFDSAAKINLSPQKRKTALLFQNYRLFPNLSVAENIGAGIAKAKSRSERQALIDQEIHRFGLESLRDRHPKQLSGGEQQRVALARMMASQPGILMLDEPFSALDAYLKELLEQSLLGIFDNFGGTILYVSHDIDEALRFCDRIAVVDEGEIVDFCTRESLVNHPNSKASIRLSGCKNIPAARYVDDHHVYIPLWNITLATESVVPKDVVALGVRAFYLQRAEGPGENCFHVQVDRTSDSRFERAALLRFLSEQPAGANVACGDDGSVNEMRYLEEHLYWRIDKLKERSEDIPTVGEKLWIRIPPDKIYLVTR